MFPYNRTDIDTVAIQINCSDDSNQQRKILLGIQEYLRLMFKSYFEAVEYKAGFDTRIEHKIYCNNKTVLSIQTGFSHNNYYLKILFAGLFTYDCVVDSTSSDYLWAVIAYINSHNITFNIAELDIAIDVPNVNFDNLLAFCSSHTSRTQYHRLGERQIYDGETNYIEKFKDKSAVNIAIKRAYIYNKTLKEKVKHNNNIGYEVARFEVKLQSKYFNRYGFDINMLAHTLSKYHLLYFENITDKYNIINRYNSYSRITQREIQRMDLEQYRLYPDMGQINIFFYYIQTLTMEELYSA